jgi:hypothetical protein
MELFLINITQNGLFLIVEGLQTGFFYSYVKFKEEQEEYEAHQKGYYFWRKCQKKKYGG